VIKIKNYIALSVIIVTYLSFILLSAIAQEGQIVRKRIYSPSLEGNLLGDSPNNRNVTIYLPPSYDIELDRFYPVVYLLHGFGANNDTWVASANENILESMKQWLKEGTVKEMILVMPNSSNKFIGSQYINSTATGNWGDYIAKDTVNYIDSNYRTLPKRESRAVFGHSMGGEGGIRIGLTYNEIFSCMGATAGYSIVDYIDANKATWAIASTLEDWNQYRASGWAVWEAMSWNAAFAPNPDHPPFYCDSPFIYTKTEPKEIVKNQEAYDKFLKNDITKNLNSYLDKLLTMRAIYIDCGTNDEYGLIEHARKLHDGLNNLGIKHTYNEFTGGHACCVLDSTGKALELFSSAMSFEVLTTGVEPFKKLTTSWGYIKNR
jgi:S-formylglutathione hydrolase FrmB